MAFEFKNDFLCSDIIPHQARYSPNKLAVVCGDQSLTWTELDARTAKIVGALRSIGVTKGDKVGIFMQSSLLMFEILWGIVRSGAVVVPMNVLLSPESLVGIVNNSQAKVIFTDQAYAATVVAVADRLETVERSKIFVAGGHAAFASADALIDAAPAVVDDVGIGPADSMNIIYTSGTTGIPKGVEHSHYARLNYYAFGFGQWLCIDRHSVALCATPLYANGTWMTMIPTMYHGGTVVILPKFSGEAFVECVERHGCTHVFLVPTQSLILLAYAGLDPARTRALKVVFSAGQALLPATHEQVRKAFPSAHVYDCYGMSEGFGTIAVPGDFSNGKIGTVGKPILFDNIVVIGEDDKPLPRGGTGEIVGYSVGLMKGYYRDPERTEQATWSDDSGRKYIRSGDVGYFDEDGYLFICGRIKDMIKPGGINVYASDIEAVFMEHPAVLEAAAIGIPHEKWIETPFLLVRLKEGASIAAEDLAAWGNVRLGKYQRVSGVEFRDDFPRATYGKVQKAALRAPYWPDAKK